MGKKVDTKTIKAFLDDLALISMKHGVFIQAIEDEGGVNKIFAIKDGDENWSFAGYTSDSSGYIWAAGKAQLGYRAFKEKFGIMVDEIESIDVSNG